MKRSRRSAHGTTAGAPGQARNLETLPPRALARCLVPLPWRMTSHGGRERTNGAMISNFPAPWSFIMYAPTDEGPTLPIQGTGHSLSVSTTAFGTFAAAASIGCTLPATPFFWPAPSAVATVRHIERPENILPARQARLRLASINTRSAWSARSTRHGCVCSARCNHISAENLLLAQSFGT